MNKNVIVFLIGILVGGLIYPAQAQRQIKSINNTWDFYKGNITDYPGSDDQTIKWEAVNIPHTWNADDVMDDEPGYYRGVGWYKKKLYIPENWKNKDVYVFFEGAAQVAEVFINGKKVGQHIGSYNAFSFLVSTHLKFSANGNTENEIVVKVDNSHNENIAPLSADFTFFGGLYRDVYLIAADRVHFDMDNHASNGIFITTPSVSVENAEVNINGSFLNNTSKKRNLLVTQQIIDADGLIIQQQEKKYNTAAGQRVSFSEDFKNIKKPKLWSVDNPYLYNVVSIITDSQTKEILDEVTNPLGFRWFKFDAEKGFFLNGKPLKLIGTSRHQDFKNKGNALTDAMHVRDVELLKEMGGNFLRIAHYPQDPTVLEACDRLGILTSVETPIVNRITETYDFAQNAKDMHLEMMRQNFNHPSLIIWAYMNEVLLRPRYEKDSEEQEAYFNKITELAQALEDITRKEDPYRYSMIPNHGNFDLYNKVKLTRIPQLVGWNLYPGWYSRDFSGFAEFLDKHHKELADKPLLITEYGADADERLHSFDPIRFDKTVEYTTIYHQEYLKAITERSFVAAAMIWNLADFNSETRAETMPHINNKGILTVDRKPKDGYRFYQANLLKTPYIQIGSREWTFRSGFADSESNLTNTQPVQVFSNQESVELRLNGKSVGVAQTEQGIARFKVPFVNGLNRLQAVSINEGLEITDQTDVYFKLISPDLKSEIMPFEEMNVSLGDKRFFFDGLAHQMWLPEQEYREGSWGYVGGKVFAMEDRSRQSYGSDKNILGTDLDPVYETQRTGIKQFKFDVPTGNYEISLLFAELLSNIEREELIYNLGNGTNNKEFKERVFNVNINGASFLQDLSNSEYLIPERAISFKTSVFVNDEKGIIIDFIPVKGEAILNGIQIRKIR